MTTEKAGGRLGMERERTDRDRDRNRDRQRKTTPDSKLS